MSNKHIQLTIIAYFTLLFFIGLGLYSTDNIRKAAEPPPTPKIHVEPEKLSLRLNGTGMIIKVIRAIFEDAPSFVTPLMEGPGMETLINLSTSNTSDKDYSVYVNATTAAPLRDSSLEGFMRLIYNFSDGKEYEKKIPVEVIIINKIKSK
jgi:hypothetical protein